MRAWSTLLVALAAAVACTAAAASKGELRARVAPTPASLVTEAWAPTITLRQGGRPAAARLVLTIRKGSSRRTFVPRATRRGSYRVRVAFPSDGRWTWTVGAGRRTLARGAILVARPVRFELPYDLAVAPDGRVFFPDRGRVLVLDATGRVRVHAATPSRELVGLALLADGTILATDLTGNRILRIDPARRVSTVAEVPAPVDLFVDPAGATAWVASLADGVGVVRVDVASGRVEPFARVENPHGIDRDARGDFVVHDGHALSRVDGQTGAATHFADVDGVKVLVAPDGSVYAVEGSPAGGRVVRVAPDGSVTTVVGNGSLGPHRDGRALDARILPSAVAVAADGSLLVAQTQPVPAIRRVDLAAGTISTLARGR